MILKCRIRKYLYLIFLITIVTTSVGFLLMRTLSPKLVSTEDLEKINAGLCKCCDDDGGEACAKEIAVACETYKPTFPEFGNKCSSPGAQCKESNYGQADAECEGSLTWWPTCNPTYNHFCSYFHYGRCSQANDEFEWFCNCIQEGADLTQSSNTRVQCTGTACWI